MYRVDTDVGDYVAPFLSLLRQLDDFSIVAASEQHLDTVHELYSQPFPCSCAFNGT